MELSLSQTFELEKLSRDIDNCDDLQKIKDLAKQLLHLNQLQTAQSKWLVLNSVPVLTNFSEFIQAEYAD